MKTEEIDKLAIAVSEESEKQTNANLIALSTGVVLRTKPVSNIVFTEFQKKHPQPKVPVWFNKENDRNESNPNDPTYIDAMKSWQFEVGLGIVDLLIILGTSFESATNNAPKLNDEEWVDDLTFAGIEFDSSNRRARYLAYVKYIAAPEDSDMEKLMARVSGQSGVAEADVKTAEDQFRDKE